MILQTAALLLLALILAVAEEVKQSLVLEEHREGANKVADQQDELSADVQQLTIEQTVPKVIELLNEVEKIMDEATDQLAAADTGGSTLAAQTEIIEKIHAAAKEKQKQEGSGQSGSAMMDMMERMMGKEPEGDQNGKGKGKGDKPSDTGSEGGSGLSDEANVAGGGTTSGKSEARRVPKASGTAGQVLPEEFRKAMDAYNRGAEQKVK
jgi:transposase